MSKTLQNPDLPPGAIVETFDDGGALRNDGVRLTPAAQNPWYVLATVAGEQRGTNATSNTPHTKNRRFWNGWMCRGLDTATRTELADKLHLPKAELEPLNAGELKKLNEHFKKAFPGQDPEKIIPDAEKTIDFRQVHFPCSFMLAKFYFANSALFHSVHFSGVAAFHEAYFTGAAGFEWAHFAKPAIFEKAQFNWAAFFREAHFDRGANFQEAHFARQAYFPGAHFDQESIFRRARIESADFSNGCFNAHTDFEGADFKGIVPRFFHREIHQNTRFSDDPSLWPVVTSSNAKDGKRAYTRLRQVAADIYDPDLEHFFLRQEMECKARIERDKRAWFHWLFFVLYRWIADSGISVARPFWLLVFVWAFGFVCFAGHFDSGVLPDLPADIQDSRYRTAAGVSFGNLFGFLGINRLYFTELLGDHIPDGLQLVSGMQTVAGVILLFFLGLGLRNWFRLK